MYLPAPEPSAGVAAYDAERIACLALDERKRRNFQKFALARAERSEDVDYFPIKLDIENVSRCNFSCRMCAVSTWPKGKRAEDMSLDAFKRLIDEQYGLVEIKLNGLGEALMQGDDYFEMIRYARARRIWVRMTTNASLLHLHDNYKKLIDSGVNEIDISIDGADTTTFEGIRVQSNFARVTENCRLLNRYAEGHGGQRAKMWTLVQKANRHGLLRHVRLAKDLGFKQVVFSVNLHGWGSDSLAQRNARESVEMTQQMAALLIMQGDMSGVRVAFWDVADKFSSESLCPWPFERAVVTSDLRTVACCMIGDPDKHELGKGLSFAQAWKSEDYRAFRRAHLSGDLPSVCKGCYKEKS